MIYALPGSTFSAFSEDFATGLVGQITVAILGPGDATYAAATTDDIYESPAGTGNYGRDTLLAPGTSGTYRVYWKAPDGSDAIEELIVTATLPVAPGAQPSSYPAPSDLQAVSGVDALKELSDADLHEVWQVSIKSIEDFCGQKFIAQPGSRVLDGGGGRTVALPVRLARLDTLTVSGSSLMAADVGLNEERSELAVLAEPGPGNWVEQVLREDQIPVFTSGVGTVTIDGVWGWLPEEMPPSDMTTPLAQAIRMDMEDQALIKTGPLAETARTMSRMRTDRLNEGPLTINTSQSIVPLSTEVQQLLSDYVWQPVARVA